jgi:hypothetical protein
LILGKARIEPISRWMQEGLCAKNLQPCYG